MPRRGPAVKDRRIIIGFVMAAVLVAVVGVAVAAITARQGPAATFVYDDDERSLQVWCDAVAQELASDAPTPSFQALAADVLAGALEEPEPVSDPADRESLTRWQREHASYLISSFVRLLEGWPKELTIEREVLVQSIEEAHAGDEITYPDDLRRGAATIDRYVARTC
jgi:hypothetical protein